MLPEILEVVHVLIDTLVGLKALDAATAAELHGKLTSQAEQEPAPVEEPAPTVPDPVQPETPTA